MLSIIKIIVLACAGLYLAIGALMYLGQRRLMYRPDSTRTAPVDVGLRNVSEKLLKTVDGETLVSWFAEPKAGRPTLLYFHGNGGALASRRDVVAAFQERGFGVLMLSYRGYSGSSGSPTEAHNVSDAKLAYDTLLAEGIAADSIVVYGESLGTGVATQLLASGRRAKGLVLDSPFTSIVERAAELYPWLPVRSVLSDRYQSDAVMGAIHVPLLIIHGAVDRIIPVDMGRRLFALANEPKSFIVIPGAGHNNHTMFGSLETVMDWIDGLSTGR